MQSTVSGPLNFNRGRGPDTPPVTAGFRLAIVAAAAASRGCRRALTIGVTADVDAPTGESRRQSGVLAFLADRQRQLEVGHHDPRRALEPESAQAALLRGAHHVLNLLMPYLESGQRAHLLELVGAYAAVPG